MISQLSLLISVLHVFKFQLLLGYFKWFTCIFILISFAFPGRTLRRKMTKYESKFTDYWFWRGQREIEVGD
jgi:hypothetical protein